MTKRPDWDNFWFTLAIIYSTRGTCDRLRVACLIVKNKRLAGAGFNGSPHGQPHCDDVGHLMIEGHCERTLHSEENAIINTSREDLRDATAYVTATPCYRCVKMLINSGVKKIYYMSVYQNSRGFDQIEELAKTSGVELVHFDFDAKQLLDQATQRLSEPGGIMFKKTE